MEKSSVILMTGAKGFIGRNLAATLHTAGFTRLIEADRETSPEELRAACGRADYVIHLAGVNRPKTSDEYYLGNAGLTETLLQNLEKYGRRTPVLMTSSIQAAFGNDYGKSKKQAEDAVFHYGEQTGAPVFVFRLEGVFGKWCRPNYNSVVATFCHKIARGLPIEIRDPAYEFPLIYIDDVVRCLLDALDGKLEPENGFYHVQPVYRVTLGRLAELVRGFAESRRTLAVPDLQEGGFEKKLYSTYTSYLPEDHFSYPLSMHADARGSFTEMLRTPERGQVSVNILHPGIVKGNHWHHSKTEKYLVVAGRCATRFRRLGTDRVVEVVTDSSRLEVVDIPAGYTHQIENIGQTDAAVIMWVNEPFDPQKPDTFPLPV